MKTWYLIPIELIFWITALILLATAPQDHFDKAHFTLCPLANLGFKWCPGCGLGRSLTQLLHGNIGGSFKLHWFGIPALLIICWRILELTKRNIKDLIKNKERDYV